MAIKRKTKVQPKVVGPAGNLNREELLHCYYMFLDQDEKAVEKIAKTKYQEQNKERGGRGKQPTLGAFTSNFKLMYKIAHASKNENEFIDFFKSGEMPPVKLTSAELSTVQGGEWYTAVIAAPATLGLSGNYWDR